MTDIKHAKVITTTTMPDGAERIESESYYEHLAHKMVEMEKQLHLPKQSLLKELIECATLLTEGSDKVTIVLERRGDTQVKVTKRWQVSKQAFPRL